jgi:uncharacterized protein YegP (UPF0339 family)
MVLEKYKSEDGFRWRIRQGRAHKIVAESGEAYSTRSNLNRAVKSFLKFIRGRVVIRDLSESEDSE